MFQKFIFVIFNINTSNFNSKIATPFSNAKHNHTYHEALTTQLLKTLKTFSQSFKAKTKRKSNSWLPFSIAALPISLVHPTYKGKPDNIRLLVQMIW